MQNATIVFGQPVRHPYITKTWKVMTAHEVSSHCSIGKTIIRAMKLTGILLFALSLHVAAKVNSQTIDFTGKDVSLEKVFTEVEKQTGFVFFYFTKDLRAARPVTIAVHNLPLKDFLALVFKDQPLKFRVDNRGIIISVKSPAEHLSTPLLLTPPPITVRGRIVNERGEPVIASIIVKGTKRGTTSDADGNFELNNIEDKALLIISGANINMKEVAVEGRAVINVSVSSKVSMEEEVVINAGYYNVKDREQTGNIAKVTSKEIEKQPVSNPLAALQGRVAGLEVTQLTGVPGGSFNIRIRGTNSLRNGNDPLYIIDGVPFISTAMSFNETSGGIYGQNDNIRYGGSSPLNSINPHDIESIEVLKDADATAIYGSRGSNGVILITTKKGKVGRTKVDVSLYSGVGRVASKMDLLNTKQYLKMRKEAFSNDVITPSIANAPDLLVWDTTRYTDWQDELLGGTANTSDAQISLSGGEKNTQFSIGAGYHKEGTVFPGDNDNKRISTHVSLINSSLDNKLKTSFSLNYSSSFTDLLNQDLTATALSLAPNSPPLYDEKGELSWTNWSFSSPNPLAYLQRRYEARTNNLIGNLGVSYFVLPNLEAKTNFGYSIVTMNAANLVPASSFDPVTASFSTNDGTFSRNDFQNWVVEPQLNWKPKLGKGQFDILIGTQFLDQKNDGLAQYGIDFPSEALMKDLGAASSTFVSQTKYSEYRYHAVFGRLNYTWDQKYFINLTGRRDGSSRFGPGKQFANFGALGIAWIFSKEAFLSSLSFLSFGKIRASYGVTGNDQLKDYEYLDTYTTSGGTYQGNVGLTPVRLSNPNFGWETNKKLETAIDLGFFKDRILLSVSYYRNRSSDQLVGYPLPPTAGFSSIQGNFPAVVENTGWEFGLNTTNLKVSDFIWSTSFNLTIPRNKILEFPDLASTSFANTYVVGEPISIRKLYHYTGISQTTGLYAVEDLNGDGNFNTTDRKTVKFVGQNYYGGILNNFKYKGFELDFLFQFVKQSGTNYYTFFQAPGASSNQPVYAMDRWRQDKSDSEVQRFSRGGAGSTAYSRYRLSEEVVSDASFIRLKNVSLSYSITSKLTEKIRAQNVRFFIQAQNFMTISNYKGLDPETLSFDYLPPLKVFTGGVSVTF